MHNGDSFNIKIIFGPDIFLDNKLATTLFNSTHDKGLINNGLYDGVVVRV